MYGLYGIVSEKMATFKCFLFFFKLLINDTASIETMASMMDSINGCTTSAYMNVAVIYKKYYNNLVI
jgi:hypothetical protein